MQQAGSHVILRSRAPVRLDFSGGWTDVRPFSTEVGGAVVNAAINRYTYATLIPREDAHIQIISADFDVFLEVRSFRELEYDGNLDLIKAAIRRMGIDIGMDLFVRCDAPPGSGTGSSASISVALIGLLNQLQDNKLSAHEIANLAHLLEIEELHIAGGKQDQFAAAVGGVNYMEFMDPAVNVSQLRLPDPVINELEKHLVMCYTGKSRLSGDLISTVMGAYQAEVPETTRALHRLKEIAREMKSALLKGDLDSFGELLSENWTCQKALDPSITNEYIESLFDHVMAHGAIGGKALGAGGGGCLLFYCQSDQEHVVRRTLEDDGAQIIDFNFDTKGLQTWAQG
jgi:D-glycero-alpha-D-manno-heptose-7-phosphate kinase